MLENFHRYCQGGKKVHCRNTSMERANDADTICTVWPTAMATSLPPRPPRPDSDYPPRLWPPKLVNTVKSHLPHLFTTAAAAALLLLLLLFVLHSLRVRLLFSTALSNGNAVDAITIISPPPPPPPLSVRLCGSHFADIFCYSWWWWW